MTGTGALVISLDFELHWGVRDRHTASGSYAANLHGARRVVPQLLRTFQEHEIAATWAVVGFLFARVRDDRDHFDPSLRPSYRDCWLDPYGESIGSSEADDPLHFAPTLIDQIAATPRQEIGTHTYSHYYCLEPGQTREQFEADVSAAVRIAARQGIELRSIVFPRNQHNPGYSDVLLRHGITAYRGNPPSWLWRLDGADRGMDPLRRAARLVDAYIDVTGADSMAWEAVLEPSGLANVRASQFLRPWSPRLREFEHLRLRRLRKGIREAARLGRIFHLWWHPHNFGAQPEENLTLLRALLDEFAACRAEHGMRSLTMAEVATIAREQPERAIAHPPVWSTT